MTEANQDLRAVAKLKGIPLWRIATHLGISEATMTRMMREELGAERRDTFIRAVEELEKDGNG